MSEEKIERVVRDFVGAIEKRDVEKILSFLTEDVVWVRPEGTFKGKGEVKHMLAWLTQTKTHIRDTGIGIMVKGNRAVYESIVEAETKEGTKYETLAIFIYEFKGEKIQRYTILYDRLSAAKQSAKGAIAKRVVSAVVKSWEKGLH